MAKKLSLTGFQPKKMVPIFARNIEVFRYQTLALNHQFSMLFSRIHFILENTLHTRELVHI